MFHEKSTGFALRLFDGAGRRLWPPQALPNGAHGCPVPPTDQAINPFPAGAAPIRRVSKKQGPKVCFTKY
jgi:hypothetical protein